MTMITEETCTAHSNTTLFLYKSLNRSPNTKQPNLRTPNSHITIHTDIISSSFIQCEVNATSDMCQR